MIYRWTIRILDKDGEVELDRETICAATKELAIKGVQRMIEQTTWSWMLRKQPWSKIVKQMYASGDIDKAVGEKDSRDKFQFEVADAVQLDIKEALL